MEGSAYPMQAGGPVPKGFTRYCSHGSQDAFLRCQAEKHECPFEVIKGAFEKHVILGAAGNDRWKQMLGYVRELKSLGFPEKNKYCRSCS